MRRWIRGGAEEKRTQGGGGGDVSAAAAADAAGAGCAERRMCRAKRGFDRGSRAGRAHLVQVALVLRLDGHRNPPPTHPTRRVRPEAALFWLLWKKMAPS